MSSSATEVLVVGAGPSGLATAIELQRFGIPFRLIDKAAGPAQWSQALVLQARSLEQFERYGIADDVVERGVKLKRASVVSEGRQLFEFELNRIPGHYPYVLFLPQNRTEEILTARLHALGGVIERGTELLSLEECECGASAQLRLRDGSEQRVQARWIIGCDGAHSVVRERLGIPFEGKSVGLSFFLGDLRLEGINVPGDEVRIYLHRGDVVFVGRLDEHLHRVIVALHDREPGQERHKKLTYSDFQAPMDRAGTQMTVMYSKWMAPFYVNERQAKYYRRKSCFLVGDASHIHSPVGGQGMNTGLQDAANLTWKLKAVRDGAPVRLLDSYHEERSPIGQRLLARTSIGLKAATSGNLFVEKFRDALLSIAGHSRHVQAAASAFLSETDIDYRNSSIVKDLGGPGLLHAGDRVPNPEFVFSDGSVNRLLDPLRDGKHLFLVTQGSRESESVRAVLPRATGVGSSDGELAELLGGPNRVAVVRPDGYLGFRGDARQTAELASYAKAVGIN